MPVNIEVLSQHLKSTLLQHSKMLLALLFGALALLLYFTSLLSQATALSDTFVDITIYTIYLLLVLVIGSITLISYHLFDEEPLIEMNSYTPEADVLNIGSLLGQKEKRLFVQEEQIENHGDVRDLLDAVRYRLRLGSNKAMRGYALVEVSQTEKIAQYLNEQHPQITAVILLMIDLKKAETVLEQLENTQRDEVINSIENSEDVSNEALMILDEALQKELSPLQKECSTLRHLGSAQIREILHHVDKKELMFALKGATQELQEKFFASMSSKASKEFKNVLASVSRIEQTKSHNAIKNLYLLAEQLRENGRIRAINKAMG